MPSSSTARRHLALVPTTNGALPRYLFKRNGVYYFKRKIPVDVAHGFPEYSEQVWKTLDTSWLEAAKVSLAVEVTEFELKVAQLRRERAMQQAAVRLALVEPTTRKSSEPPSAKPVVVVATSPERVVSPPHVTVTSAPPKPSGPGRPSMLHLFEDWRRKQTRHRTINAVEAAVLEFRTLHGPLAVEDITKTHARAYRDSLVERQLSKGTVENRLGFLATLVRHGMKEMVEQLGVNAFERIEVTAGRGMRRPKDRRAYEVAELNILFASRLYTDGYRPAGQVVDAAYWAPLLGPFVGARIEEVCQLRVEDVQRVNGTWCIRICDLAPDQNIKTLGSFRRVPLHDAVIRSGFLLYAAEMARAGHERLFPTLSNENANRIYSNSVGKWFGRYLESVGLVDHRLDYHSFRYTFRQQASLCGIDNEVRDALTGHWLSNSDSGRTYMKAENRQYPFPKLVAAMGQLRYDELRISHLFVDEPLEGVEEALIR
jgi:integrase